MIINHCPDCQQYFYDTEYLSVTPYQIKILTDYQWIKEAICDRCAEKRMLVERMNLAANSCGACCDDLDI